MNEIPNEKDVDEAPNSTVMGNEQHKNEEDDEGWQLICFPRQQPHRSAENGRVDFQRSVKRPSGPLWVSGLSIKSVS